MPVVNLGKLDFVGLSCILHPDGFQSKLYENKDQLFRSAIPVDRFFCYMACFDKYSGDFRKVVN